MASTLSDWQGLRDTIEEYLFTGKWLRKEIDIDGDKVVFTSLGQVKDMLSFVEGKIAQIENGGNSASNLRTSAWFGGNGLR